MAIILFCLYPLPQPSPRAVTFGGSHMQAYLSSGENNGMSMPQDGLIGQVCLLLFRFELYLLEVDRAWLQLVMVFVQPTSLLLLNVHLALFSSSFCQSLPSFFRLALSNMSPSSDEIFFFAHRTGLLLDLAVLFGLLWFYSDLLEWQSDCSVFTPRCVRHFVL